MAEEGTLTIREEVLRKAGNSASATSSAEEYTNQFIKEVEGHLSAIARINLVTNYLSISTIGKEFLRNLASNLAAIFVLQYDFDATGSRIESENRINVLWATSQRGIDLLSDQKFVTFIL